MLASTVVKGAITDYEFETLNISSLKIFNIPI
jgi:hypothetical protein